MSDRHTCAACGHEDNAPELYAQAIPGGDGGAWYCRNHNACQRRRKEQFANQRKENTMFGTYEEPPAPVEGDAYAAREHYGNSVIVKVLRVEESKVTTNSPGGAPAVFVDVYDLNLKQVFRDVMMMTGAIVDGFRPHVGRDPIVVKWDRRVAKSGRDFAAPVPAVEAAVEAAKAVYAAGDPFTPTLGTIESEAPF